MKFHFILVLIVLFTAFVAVNIYVCIRGFQALPSYKWLKTTYVIVFCTLTLLFFVSLFLQKHIPIPVNAVLQYINAWLVIILYSFLFFVFFDIIKIILYSIPSIQPFITTHWTTIKLFALIFMIVTISCVCGYGYYRFSHPVVTKLALNIQKKSFEELKIVAVSDVHLGYIINKQRLHQYVDKINALKPDIVLIAGDLFDRDIDVVRKQKMEEELNRISAKDGVYAVVGNHEYYASYYGNIDNYIASLSIHFLRDTAIIINNKFCIIGRDDYTNRKRKPLSELVKNIDKQMPIIVLDHQPNHLEEAAENGIDLQISGHTHDGQFFPVNKIVKHMYELSYGYKQKGNTHYYVSSGLGLWGPPFRIGTKSEIVEITFSL